VGRGEELTVRLALLALPLLLAAATSASATTFSFDCITGSGSSTDCGIGEDQLSVEVSAGPGAGQVSFTLRNDGSEAITAAELYFDDDANVLASLVSVTDGSGVDFEDGEEPPDLPGGNSESFDADFLATAENPAPHNGVNPGEEVTVTFSLLSGNSLADVLDALESGELRLGVHAIAFEDGKSKSFINDPDGVPEPGTLALLALGVGGLWAFHRSRKV